MSMPWSGPGAKSSSESPNSACIRSRHNSSNSKSDISEKLYAVKRPPRSLLISVSVSNENVRLNGQRKYCTLNAVTLTERDHTRLQVLDSVLLEQASAGYTFQVLRVSGRGMRRFLTMGVPGAHESLNVTTGYKQSLRHQRKKRGHR